MVAPDGLPQPPIRAGLSFLCNEPPAARVIPGSLANEPKTGIVIDLIDEVWFRRDELASIKIALKWVNIRQHVGRY